MPNPSGANQFRRTPPAYGDVAKQTQLAREAPISGAPIAVHAENAPRRAQRRTQRPSVPKPPPPTPEQVADAGVGAPQPTYAAQVAAVWDELASTPGAPPLINQYAAEARKQATIQ